jgi:hypothetical protein
LLLQSDALASSGGSPGGSTPIGHRIGDRALLRDGIGDRTVIGKNPVVLHDGPNSRPCERRNHSQHSKIAKPKEDDVGVRHAVVVEGDVVWPRRLGAVATMMLLPLTVVCSAWLSFSTRMVCGVRNRPWPVWRSTLLRVSWDRTTSTSLPLTCACGHAGRSP